MFYFYSNLPKEISLISVDYKWLRITYINKINYIKLEYKVYLCKFIQKA